MKSIRTITLDSDLVKILQSRKIVLSTLVNEYLWSYINLEKEDDGQEEDVLNMDIVELEAKLSKKKEAKNIINQKKKRSRERDISKMKLKKRIRDDLMESIRKKEFAITGVTPEEAQIRIEEIINERFTEQWKDG